MRFIPVKSKEQQAILPPQALDAAGRMLSRHEPLLTRCLEGDNLHSGTAMPQSGEVHVGH
jgi:hypothetical protein